MKDRLSGLFGGDRNGVDELTRFTTILALIIAVIANFVGAGSAGSVFFCVLALVILVYGQFRSFSGNIQKRRAENERFLEVTKGIRSIFHRGSGSQDKTHTIFACPECGQRIRVPKGRGKMEITCPKCKAKFIKRS